MPSIRELISYNESTSAPSCLVHLARRFGGEVDLADFRPEARYDASAEVVEGLLWVQRDQRIVLPGLGLNLDLRRGEAINVGFSAKFDHNRIVRDVGAHGLAAEAEWVDHEQRYGISSSVAETALTGAMRQSRHRRCAGRWRNH